MEGRERRLLSKVTQACQDFNLVAEGDKIMVAMSGGKDSYVLLHLLQEVQRRLACSFELVAVHLDQQQPGFDTELVARFLADCGVPFRVISRDTYSIVKDNTAPGKAFCTLCSRLRRGILYAAAVEMGCTKIALGHHRDDSIETLLMNLLYSGQIKAMPPRLTSDDGRNVVVRPLISCAEADIAELAGILGFPVQACTVCSSQPDLKRTKIKALIDELHADNPNVRGNMFAALGNVVPSHLLDAALREATGAEALRGDDEGLLALDGGCSAA